MTDPQQCWHRRGNHLEAAESEEVARHLYQSLASRILWTLGRPFSPPCICLQNLEG
jgi:hypothetical protein